MSEKVAKKKSTVPPSCFMHKHAHTGIDGRESCFFHLMPFRTSGRKKEGAHRGITARLVLNDCVGCRAATLAEAHALQWHASQPGASHG